MWDCQFLGRVAKMSHAEMVIVAVVVLMGTEPLPIPEQSPTQPVNQKCHLIDCWLGRVRTGVLSAAMTTTTTRTTD